MADWIDATSPDKGRLPDLPPIVARLLLRQGITTPAEARAFLDPAAYSPALPGELPGMQQAVERVKSAIENDEPICVWGDFDVDGQTSTTALVQTLTALGAKVTYHIPVRARESHGINLPNLNKVIDNGAKLILTCDTGISDHEAVEHAASRNVDVVITDHHDLPDRLPPAAAVVNPKLLPGTHPLASLPGAGVAYQFSIALLEACPPCDLDTDSLLDLVALGIVADVALLHGDNRSLLQRGLEILRNTGRLGLQVMMELAEMEPANLTEEHIGFVLGPRLNALGRLDDANPSVEMFTTKDPVRARVLATQLEGLNTQRQLLTNQVYQAAEAKLRNDPSLLENPVLLLSHEGWPGGIIGIVASRLVERYRRPAILISTSKDGLARGSARSIEGLHITEAIAAQKDLLHGFGGHPMAAGLSLDPENLASFRRRLFQTVKELLKESTVDSRLKIDAWMELPELSLDLAEQIERVAPFGPGNEKPVLATRNLKLRSAAGIGRNQEHARLVVEDEQENFHEVLWWNGGSEPHPQGQFDLAFTLRASNFRGVRQTQLELVDFRLIEPLVVEKMKRTFTITDLRGEKDPHKLLKDLDQPAMIWAEETHKKQVSGVHRASLSPADTLVIWTSPPGLAELKHAIEVVRPSNIVIVGKKPETDDFENFVTRLAGLVKYSLNKKNGLTNLAELAGATAQREVTVRKGLDWLAARRMVEYQVEDNSLVRLSPGSQGTNDSRSTTRTAEIQSLLAETAAFREHFARAELKSLLDN